MQGWIAVTPKIDTDAPARAPLTSYTYQTADRSKKHIVARDLIFLRDQRRLVAVARVEDVTSKRRELLVRKCPFCGVADIEARKQRGMRYRCFHGHQFTTPVEAHELAVSHTVLFSYDYAAVAAQIEPAELRPFELTNSRHVKLKRADLIGLCSYVARRDHKMAAIFRDWLNHRMLDLGDGDGDSAEFHPLPSIDEQDKPFFAIRQRRGLTTFRDKLIRRYGPRCMVTGCAVLALLEACAVNRQGRSTETHPANGVLLRSDLHTLFDLDLIGFNPQNMELVLHEDLTGSEYEMFAGTRLVFGNGQSIDMRAVQARWEEFTRKMRHAAHSAAVPSVVPDITLVKDTTPLRGRASLRR